MQRNRAASCTSGTNPTADRCTRRPGKLTTHRDIVDAYVRDRRAVAASELRFYAFQPSLADAVNQAALCQRPNGKRHDHQRRIPPGSLAEARRRLLAADLGTAADFDELHDAVTELIDDIHRIGPLTIYDIAHRIGAYLGLAPELVYLHRGTRDGARALGLGSRRKTLEMHNLPREFQRLTAAEAEDCLCIYKAEIKRITPRGGP